MRLKIHRGTKQIGGNIVEIATETTRIILDCGRNLPPLDEPNTADNIKIEGLTCGKSAYDAVFITHYHADHCGLIGRVNPDIPIYMSNETDAVLNVIADFIDKPPIKADKLLQPGREEIVGDISILPISVHHSAKGAMAFLIRANGQTLLYTGDFKQIDEAYYSLIGNIDVLLCEGTNIAARNDKTEKYVENEAARIMSETRGQVFVLCSTTNIDRIHSIESACKKSGRTIAIDPFMKPILDRISDAPLDKFIGFVPYYIDEKETPRRHKYLMRDIKSFAGARTVSKQGNLTFMVRQSMGKFIESLNKLAPLSDSVLIYSTWRGYEESKSMKAFLDVCHENGMEIIPLHASGHAYREQLETAVLRLRPTAVIPIHTQSADAFREFHDNVILLEDGESYNCAID